MAAALGSSLPAPADATTAAAEEETAAAAVAAAVAAAAATEAAAATTTVATAAAAAIEDDLEDPMDVVLASALEGINLALSIDNSLGFSAMSLVSRELEIQGEPPQVSVLSSPLSQGEPHSRVSPMPSPAHISSYMEMLFDSKISKCSDPPERPESFPKFEDQLQEVNQLVLDLHRQFASFQESINTSLQEIKSEFQVFLEQ